MENLTLELRLIDEAGRQLAGINVSPSDMDPNKFNGLKPLADAYLKLINEIKNKEAEQYENMLNELTFVGKSPDGTVVYMNTEGEMFSINRVNQFPDIVTKMFDIVTEGKVDRLFYGQNTRKDQHQESTINLKKSDPATIEYKVYRGMTFLFQDETTRFNVYIHNLTRKFYQDENNTLREIEKPTHHMIDASNMVRPIFKKDEYNLGIDASEELKNRLSN